MQDAKARKEAAKAEERIATRQFLASILDWRAAENYAGFVTCVAQTLGVSESTANNYLRAARTADRAGVLQQDPDAKIEDLSRLAAVERLANSHDPRKRRYAESLVERIKARDPLPSVRAMLSDTRDDTVSFSTAPREYDDKPEVVEAYMEFLLVLAQNGDAQAHEVLLQMQKAICAKEPVRYRLTLAARIQVRDQTEQKVLLQRIGKALGSQDSDAQTPEPPKSDPALQPNGRSNSGNEDDGRGDDLRFGW